MRSIRSISRSNLCVICLYRYNKAQRLFEAGLENCADNPYLLQAFAVMEEGRGNQAKASLCREDATEVQQ